LKAKCRKTACELGVNNLDIDIIKIEPEWGDKKA
jgi:hypothetical protein